jgi:asparagine synthase (glutamine-hydrolysing)
VRLRFGSEIKAILADPGVSRQPDWEGLDAFLTFGYVPAPLTGFAGVKQLPPGCWLVAEGGGVRVEPYFQMPYPDGPPSVSVQEGVESLRHALHASVRRQMVSDVPLGVLVSGGIDSAAVARAMRQTDPGAIDGFHISFEEQSFDESPFACEVARACGIDLHERTLTARGTDLLARAVWHAEEPLADNSMLPFFLLAGFARERVTVALSGDGADELLAGYMTYKASRLAPTYRRLPAWLRRHVIAPAAESLPAGTRKYGLAMLARRFVAGAEEGPWRDHCSWRQILSARRKAALYADLPADAAEWDALGRYAGSAADAPAWLRPLERQLHADFRFHLPSDMLAKVDRMSMAHALEVRVPFLDIEVVQACLRLPPELKLRGRCTKYALKQLLSDVLPRRVVHRSKRGFVIPIERWLRSEWLPLLREHLRPDVLRRIPALRAGEVARMIDRHAAGTADHAYELFALLVLSLWWQMWIEQGLHVQRTRTGHAPPTVRRIPKAT